MRFLNCFFLLCVLISNKANGQSSNFQLQNYRPISPSAFEFLKYNQIPLSEYTGIPNISVPIYQLEEDGFSLPLSLSYHAGGIRVSQEASWVGLGWDLGFGSIVQEINDRDDYDDQTLRLRPDWVGAPIPSYYYRKYYNASCGQLNPGYSDVEPVMSPIYDYAYSIFTSYLVPSSYYYFLPINGHKDQQPQATNLINNLHYDSEPDIFTANFFGHSLKFLRDPTGNQIHILNQGSNGGGYKVSKIASGFKVITPNGEQVYFENSATIESNTFTSTCTGSSSTGLSQSSRIFVITKVITRNGRELSFQYTQMSAASNLFSVAQRRSYELGSNPFTTSGLSNVEAFSVATCMTGVFTSISYSQENKLYLSKITFPLGQINFTLSNRDDILGGKKLDQIEVFSEGVMIRSLAFQYSYLTSIGSEVPDYGNTPNLRLRLDRIQDNAGGIHNFEYNPTPLPSKTSYAQDYWGFYNGSNNTTLDPNPARLTTDQRGTAASLGDNRNNHSANLLFAKAAVLIGITYPTGGKVSFEFGLNKFDNYWVPDFNSNSNTISSGNGLRIESITHKADGVNISTKVLYDYEEGKALETIGFGRVFTTKQAVTISNFVGNPRIDGKERQICELSGKGFFSSSSLGSGNYVGYGKVIKKEVDFQTGNTLGKTETSFHNTIDRISSSAIGFSQVSVSLPPIKERDSIENGTIKSIHYFNEQNILVRKIENEHYNTLSELFYGARFFGYAHEYYRAACGDEAWVSVPKSMSGFYPIIDKKTFLQSTKTSDYDEQGKSFVSTVGLNYDPFGQVSLKTTRSSKDEFLEEWYENAYDYSQRTGDNRLTQANNWAEVTAYVAKRRKPDYYFYTYAFKDMYKFEKQYKNVGSSVVVDKVLIYDQASLNSTPKEIIYEQYDNNANPTQILENGVRASMLWDYQDRYLIAEAKNAPLSDIAYTSFEAGGKGRWSFKGTPIRETDVITGKKVYNLQTGNISITGLNDTKTYVLSYWSKNGPQYVSGATLNQTGRTHSVWTYYESRIVSPPSGSLYISGTGTIDELRLYPLGSQMVSYTYDPLIGVTSKNDINNRIEYYEYDGSNRLALVRDLNKKIQKKICYNYQGQPENCYNGCITTAPDWQAISAPTCLTDGTNNTGYIQVQEQDINPCSVTYNTTRTTTTYDPYQCPIPVTCDCSAYGEGWGCVNGQCEYGIKVYTEAYNDGTGMWVCTYHYEFSDGSWSYNYYQYSGSSCYNII